LHNSIQNRKSTKRVLVLFSTVSKFSKSIYTTPFHNWLWVLVMSTTECGFQISGMSKIAAPPCSWWPGQVDLETWILRTGHIPTLLNPIVTALPITRIRQHYSYLLSFTITFYSTTRKLMSVRVKEYSWLVKYRLKISGSCT